MLTSKYFNRQYYEEHKAAGLDYTGHGEWQLGYGTWLVQSLDLVNRFALDVGCACGSVAEGLRKAGAKVAAIDLCSDMIVLGRSSFPDLALAVCDAVNLHLVADASQDFYHSNQVGEHWRPDHVPMILSEAFRVLKPGGYFFFVADTTEYFTRNNINVENEDPTNRCIRSLRWWEERMLAAGFDFDPAARAALIAHPKSYLKMYDWDWLIMRKPDSKVIAPTGGGSGSLQIVTAATPDYDRDNLIKTNRERFAKASGLRCDYVTDGFDLTRPPAWSKLNVIGEALDTSDWIFWLDADALFVDKIDLTTFCDSNVDMVMSLDRHGVNTGAMFVKNSEWSRTFLRRVWGMGDADGWRDHPWWEQGAINRLLLTDESVRSRIKLLPHRLFNAMPMVTAGYAPGDPIVHFPGLTTEEKWAALKEWSGRLSL